MVLPGLVFRVYPLLNCEEQAKRDHHHIRALDPDERRLTKHQGRQLAREKPPDAYPRLPQGIRPDPKRAQPRPHTIFPREGIVSASNSPCRGGRLPHPLTCSDLWQSSYQKECGGSDPGDRVLVGMRRAGMKREPSLSVAGQRG